MDKSRLEWKVGMFVFIGLVLLAVTILVNVIAQLMLRSLAGRGTGKIN